MTKENQPKHFFTKDEIKAVAKLWSEKSVENIASQLDILPRQVLYLAREMRKEGFILSQKRRNGQFRSLIREVFNEEGVSVIA